MWVLNVIYFLIITYFGFKYLLSDGGIVRSPFNKEERLKLNGPEMFWCLTFSTGLLAFSANVGLDLMAVRLGVLELLCIIGLSVVKNKPIWTVPLVLYIIYLVWLLIGCTYAPSWGYGIRVILKYLYPLLICLFASAAVRHIEVWMKSALLARLVALICVIAYFVPFIRLLVPNVFWYVTAGCINFISIMILSLALFYFTDNKKTNLIYSILFILPCFVMVFRTSIMGSLVAIMAFFFIKYRVKSLPIIAGLLIAGVIAVFTIPSLRQKMFMAHEQNNVSIEQFQDGKVSMDQVNTNARAAMWEHLESIFYEGHELYGSGTGSVQNYMYNNHIFGGLKVPHSDIVQIKCDNGIIGICLYAFIAILIFLHCFCMYWRTHNQPLKLAAIVAGASLAGVIVTLYSDNVVNYSMATLSMPFGFYGMALGLHRAHNENL